MPPGGKRVFGFASCDMNEEGNIIGLGLTSFEENGSVNKYTNKGDGTHTHEYWKQTEDYLTDKEPDQKRMEGHPNPSEEQLVEIQNKDCYLTTACLKHYETKGKQFDDNCCELKILREFRDKQVPQKDIAKYYKIAPKIVEEINKQPKEIQDKIYNYIYNKMVYKSILYIAKNRPIDAYNTYKNNTIYLAKKFNIIEENTPQM